MFKHDYKTTVICFDCKKEINPKHRRFAMPGTNGSYICARCLRNRGVWVD
jgi:hypothetical protein